MARKIACCLLLLACLTLVLSPTARCEESPKEIVATGLGGGKDPGKARDEAINDAMRKAIEQGVGTFVSSESLVDKMVLVEDRIYSESRGFIDSYKILSEKKDDGIYEITIAAVVKMADLAKGLEAIGLILSKKENPRVMVIVHSKETSGSFIPVAMEGNRSTENQLEKILLGKGFRLVDAAQTQRKKELEGLLLAGDPSRAAIRAKDFGAEILIDADVRRTFTDQRQVMGRSMRFFTNEIRLKALETDTAKILYSGYETKPASGEEALQPLESATNKLAKEMVSGILEQWRKDVYQAAAFTLNLTKVSFSQLNNLSAALKEVRGVSKVQTRSFQGSVAALEVAFQGSATDLAGKIGEITGSKFEVTGVQANTIDLKPVGK
ncbi:MAG: hypothetical protein HGA96_01120 [Desulfobulbaceae bacterium]|nr:hypothetical protein [Desulfobulbaceae bacterium]